MRAALIVITGIAFGGCAPADRHPPSPDAYPRVVGEAPAKWPAVWGSAEVIEYETLRDVRNVPVLRQEAESVWTVLRPRVEANGYCVVQLRASEPELDLAVPGSNKELTLRRHWDFLILRDSSGAWNWLSTLQPPAKPCTPASRERPNDR